MSYQYVLCQCDYTEYVMTSFANQIQSEYYGVNIYVFIEGIALHHSDMQQTTSLSESDN